MKGLILSGGAGTRMRPLTHSNAKQLLPIANRPILHRAIANLVDVGVVDIVIVVGDTARLVMDSVGDGRSLGARVVYVHQEAPLGLAHCVSISRHFLDDSPFVMYLGDNMFEEGIAGFTSDFYGGVPLDGRIAQVAVKPVDNPSAFGIATVDSTGRLSGVVEKPRQALSNLALVGTYLFTPVVHEAIESITPSARGELEITDAIQWLIERGHTIGVTPVSGWWYDTGNPQSFLDCNSAVLRLEGIDAPKVPAGVSLIPPCIVDPSAVLENCTIGPFSSIGAGAVVVDAIVSESAVFKDGIVKGKGVVHRSIIGERSSVTLANDAKVTVVAGDDCTVEVSQ